MTGWNNPHTAEIYDNYAKTASTYRETNQDLVRLATIEPDMQVIDLACGTGMTSTTLLNVLDESGKIYAVDAAEAMLDIAKQNITADNIEFFHIPSDQLHTVTNEPVDRILCNSAFWQLPADETLTAINSVLKSDGRLVFNIPTAFSPPAPASPKSDSPNIRALMREAAETVFGLKLPPAKPRDFQFTRQHIPPMLAEHDFVIIRHQRIRYEHDMQDGIAFCHIPVMTESTLPGIEYDKRMEVLKYVTENLEGNSDMYPIEWDFYVVGRV